ncbi:UNVERIFIED_CONTAM: hypothetical protein Sradi_0763800 [Sesamum radiatum]|uniref:Uncharacterized protein n=1 Tax=Sesamum radiatum TaxID=300843 RepID=A0AAW2VPX3_SESRA
MSGPDLNRRQIGRRQSTGQRRGRPADARSAAGLRRTTARSPRSGRDLGDLAVACASKRGDSSPRRKVRPRRRPDRVVDLFSEASIVRSVGD